MNEGMMGTGFPYGVMDLADASKERMIAAAERIATAVEHQTVVQGKILGVLIASEKHINAARQHAGEIRNE
jgi:hypothetical protein